MLKAFPVAYDTPKPPPVSVGKVETIGLLILALLVIGLGLYPTGLVDFINNTL